MRWVSLDRIRNTQGNIDFSYIDFTVHKSIEEMVAHSTEDTVHNTLEYCMCNGVDFTKMTWDEVQNLENKILNKWTILSKELEENDENKSNRLWWYCECP